MGLCVWAVFICGSSLTPTVPPEHINLWGIGCLLLNRREEPAPCYGWKYSICFQPYRPPRPEGKLRPLVSGGAPGGWLRGDQKVSKAADLTAMEFPEVVRGDRHILPVIRNSLDDRLTIL